MFRLKSTLMALAIVLLACSASFAQTATLKIGYTSAAQILPAMPEFKLKQTELQSYSKVLEDELKKRQEEIQAKMKELEEKGNTMIPVVIQEREKEIRALQQGIYEFQQTAELDLQKKEKELLDPLYDKVQTAIDAVAKEGAYTLIMNGTDGSGGSTILYADPSLDVTDIVLKKMGITPPIKTGGK